MRSASISEVRQRRVLLLQRGINKARKNWVWSSGLSWYDQIVDQGIFCPELSLILRAAIPEGCMLA